MAAYASVDDFITTLPSLAREHAAQLRGITGCVILQVAGHAPVAFSISESGVCQQADPAAAHADCTIRAKEVDLLRILNGELKPLKALMTGRIAVEGNAAKLMSILKRLT